MKNLSLKKHYFTWAGLSPQGKKIEGITQSFSLNLVNIHLKQQGITPLFIRKKYLSPFSRHHKITTQDIAIFCRQLAMLLQAGIPIVPSCEILLQSQHSISFSLFLKSIKSDLETGKSFSTSLKKFPHYFDTLTRHLINVGEQSGTLDAMLLRAAHYKEKSLALKNKIKQALFYPISVFIVAILISLTLLIFVVPRFAELFDSFHGNLPSFTLGVIRLSHFVRQDYWILIIILLSAGMSFYYAKHSAQFKKTADKLTLKLPFIGGLIQKIICARFARTLATLFSSGISIVQALTMMADISCNPIFKQSLLRLQSDIATGHRLHYAMQSGQLFPPLMINMVKVGEESGSLDTLLEKIAEFYEADIDYWVLTFNQLLEPLIIIVLGVLIGGLVIALYLPIFKLGTVI